MDQQSAVAAAAARALPFRHCPCLLVLLDQAVQMCHHPPENASDDLLDHNGYLVAGRSPAWSSARRVRSLKPVSKTSSSDLRATIRACAQDKQFRQHRADGTQLAMHPEPLSLSLSLSLSDEPSHESRNAGTFKQTKQCTLYSADSRGGTAAGRSATLDPNTHKYVSACAVSSTRSSWVLHLPTACGLHCPFAAAVATKSRSNLGAHNALLQPHLVSTHFWL